MSPYRSGLPEPDLLYPQRTGPGSVGPPGTPRSGRHTGRMLAVVTVAAAALVLASAVTARAATTPRAQPGGLSWHPCQDISTVDCATLRVPIDWKNPGGGTLDLA